MPDDVAEWAAFIASRLARTRAVNAVTLALLRRSREQLARSKELLNRTAPKVLHPPETEEPDSPSAC
jgi:hypothetical protein